MQNTRLNNLFDFVLSQLERWLANPWRRLSLLLISFLLGIFLGTAISTTAGQRADWDVATAAVLVFFTEITSRIVYGGNWRRTSPPQGVVRTSFLVDSINVLKVGLIYSMFLEAFKLGS